MKRLSHLTSALALTLVLAISASAGLMDTPAPPPPPPASSSASTGDIWIPGAATESALIDGLTLLKDLLLAF